MIKKMWFLTIISHLILQSISVFHSPIDFLENREEAKKWGDEKYSEWFKKISSEEKKAFKTYAISGHHTINRYLRENKGQMVDDWKNVIKHYELGIWDVEKDLNQEIRNIYSALKKVKTQQPLFVYRNVGIWQFDNWVSANKKNDLLINGKVNIEAFEEFKTNFQGKKFKQYSFISTSLIHSRVFAYTSPILMKIKVPKGIHAGFLNNELSVFDNELELLINKDYTFEYNDFSIINNNDSEKIKVKVSLIN